MIACFTLAYSASGHTDALGVLVGVVLLPAEELGEALGVLVGVVLLPAEELAEALGEALLPDEALGVAGELGEELDNGSGSGVVEEVPDLELVGDGVEEALAEEVVDVDGVILADAEELGETDGVGDRDAEEDGEGVINGSGSSRIDGTGKLLPAARLARRLSLSNRRCILSNLFGCPPPPPKKLPNPSNWALHTENVKCSVTRAATSRKPISTQTSVIQGIPVLSPRHGY